MLSAKDRLVALSDELENHRVWLTESAQSWAGSESAKEFHVSLTETLNLAYKVNKTLYRIEQEESEKAEQAARPTPPTIAESVKMPH